MPYIDPVKRRFASQTPTNPGELNYAITRLIRNYIWRMGLNYQHINDVLGALEGARLEFYRRMVVDYEDKKRCENGDVY